MGTRHLLVGMSTVLFLAACGGGGGGGTSEPTGDKTVVASQMAFDSNPTCPNGGVQIDIGIDENGNGLLDPDEVDIVDYLCNGADGTAGPDGLTSLVVVSPESAGANCSDGGLMVEVGLDDSLDGVLDAAEVDTTSYICDGAPGEAGTDGLDSLVSVTAVLPGPQCTYGGIAVDVGLDENLDGILDSAEIDTTSYVCNGADGLAGSDGAAGTDGFNSLVVTAIEDPGPNCTWGGIRFDVGLDDDRSGTLEEGEIDATRYVCNGEPGSSGGGSTVWYVDIDASGTTADGTTWQTAFRHPQDALDNALYGDQVWVAAGTYTPYPFTLELLHMEEGVSVYGGFAGGETDFAQRDWEANTTVLDGQGIFHVVYGADAARLDGFTVTGGVADDIEGELAQGGGMYNYRVTPIVANCLFTGNHATFGGGMYNWGNFPNLENVTFEGNSADLGGGFYGHASIATVSGGTFVGNIAREGGGFYTTFRSAASFSSVIFTANMATAGAGILAEGETPVVLTSGTLSSNLDSSGSGGEGILSRGGMVTATDSVFSDNAGDGINCQNGTVTAIDSVFGGNGGGSIYASNTDVLISGGTFLGDYANGVYVDGGTLAAENSSFTGYTQFGPALYASNSVNTVTSCLFTGNRRNQSGGAVRLSGTTDTFRRVSFTDNGDPSYASLFGGALYANNSTGIFSTCDFTNNAAGNFGGAVYGGSFTFSGCSFTGNSSVNDGGALYGDGVFNNCTFDGNAATGTYGDGGAVYINTRTAVFTSCTFTGNTAAANGGAMMVANSSSGAGSGTSISDSAFTGNGASGSGGAVATIRPYYMTITNSTISGNAASVDGGGMANGYVLNSSTYGGIVTLIDSVVSGNTAGGNGGGVSQSGNGSFVPFTLAVNSDITGNAAGGNGGGVALRTSYRAHLDRVRITSNSADGYGGGIFAEYDGPEITSTVISGNSAAEGGGIYTFGFDSNSGTNMELVNSTVTGNQASGAVGGVYHGGEQDNWAYSLAYPHAIVNSVLWGNSGVQVAYTSMTTNHGETPLSVTWSDVMVAGASTPYAGSGNINADPLFAVDGTWSGGVWTDGDYHLSAGSPAIDAGDSGAVTTSYDFAGLPREVNQVDMGAYEYQGP